MHSGAESGEPVRSGSKAVIPDRHADEYFPEYACVYCGCLRWRYFEKWKLPKYKSVMWGTGTLTVLVVLSTVFLKQHSVVDVVFSIVLYGICYYVFYRVLPGYKEEITRLATREELLTVPNLLSTFRLVLAVLFWGIYQRYGGMAENRKLLTGILLLSGITDFLDGKIARRFHMVSEVGKILDPIADKVTQGVLLICFFSEYEVAKGVFLLFLIKECYMSVMGTRAIKRVKKNEGAKWYGKINTAVFYAAGIYYVWKLLFCPVKRRERIRIH